MNQAKKHEFQYLLHLLDDDDLPGKDTFLGASIKLERPPAVRPRTLRPANLLFPIALAQLIIFISAMFSAHPVTQIVIGNLALVVVAILPGIIRLQKAM